MSTADWLQFDAGALFIWASFAAALALFVVEIVALDLRGRAIRGHLGWGSEFRRPRAPSSAPGAD